MTHYCKDDLQRIQKMLISLSEVQFQFKSTLLSGASIGEHVRHILEYYLCLLEGSKSQVVNYDNRQRSPELETNPAFAISTIDEVCSNFIFVEEDKEISLESNFSSTDSGVSYIKTSVNRELAYCLEHSIHHQALIKVALAEQNLGNLIDEMFGVAAATMRHKYKCAQ